MPYSLEQLQLQIIRNKYVTHHRLWIWAHSGVLSTEETSILSFHAWPFSSHIWSCFVERLHWSWLRFPYNWTTCCSLVPNVSFDTMFNSRINWLSQPLLWRKEVQVPGLHSTRPLSNFKLLGWSNMSPSKWDFCFLNTGKRLHSFYWPDSADFQDFLGLSQSGVFWTYFNCDSNCLAVRFGHGWL